MYCEYYLKRFTTCLYVNNNNNKCLAILNLIYLNYNINIMFFDKFNFKSFVESFNYTFFRMNRLNKTIIIELPL